MSACAQTQPESRNGDPLIDRDLATIRDVLIVLSGHLPLFAANPKRRARAEDHLRLRGEAFDALDRVCDALGQRRLRRSMHG